MIGLLLNTIPVRVLIRSGASFSEWARQLRASWIELRRFEHTPLVRIKASSEIPFNAPMFDSLIVVENGFFGTELRNKGAIGAIAPFPCMSRPLIRSPCWGTETRRSCSK